MEIYCCKILILTICEVKYHLKVECGRLKMHTVNPKATTKIT